MTEHERKQEIVRNISSPLKQRPFVDEMARLMEERLRANDHKNAPDTEGVFDCTYEAIAKLLEEVHELIQVVTDLRNANASFDDLRREAADVANVAGMLAFQAGYSFALGSKVLPDPRALRYEES